MSSVKEDVQAPQNAWFVYMILTNNNHLYTGIARDVERRLQEHKDVRAGKRGARGAKFFRSQSPMQVVYVEAFADRPQALRRERLIKGMTAVQKRRLCAEQAADAAEGANPALID